MDCTFTYYCTLLKPKTSNLNLFLPVLMADTDERSERDGTARLCVQYEMEMSSSKNRPMSLLDALDKSDPNQDEDDTFVGEEKVSGEKKGQPGKREIR